MKTLTKLLSQISLICCLCTAIPAQADPPPGREATAAWLRGKLKGYYFNLQGISSDKSVLVSHSVQDIQVSSAGRIEIRLQTETSVGELMSMMITVAYVQLDKLSPVCPVEEAAQGFTAFGRSWCVSLSTSSGKSIQVIQQKGTSREFYPAPLTHQETFPTDKLRIQFADQDLANRVARALEHLVTVSGGQHEPF